MNGKLAKGGITDLERCLSLTSSNDYCDFNTNNRYIHDVRKCVPVSGTVYFWVNLPLPLPTLFKYSFVLVIVLNY